MHLDFARGFIGIAFRIDDEDSTFESFYVRPTNGRIDDPVRKIEESNTFPTLNTSLIILGIMGLQILKARQILDLMSGSV